ALRVARTIVAAKATNQRTVLMRALRDHGQKLSETARAAIDTACSRMVFIVRDVLSASTKDLARGREGEAASLYFSVFDHLVLSGQAELHFSGRSRRPPRDRINALMS